MNLHIYVIKKYENVSRTYYIWQSLSVFLLPTDTIVQHYINMVSTQCSWSPSLYYVLDRRTDLAF